MTERYLKHITPDGISGSVLAYQGVRDSVVLLNGPLGCRYFHAYSAARGIFRQIPKRSDLWGLQGGAAVSDALPDGLIRSQWFGGTPDIPATNVRYEDYIFGTREQLHRALSDIASERRFSLLAVIQTPGTSLLGEGLEDEIAAIAAELGIPYVFEESPQLSSDLCRGFDASTVRLLERVLGRRNGRAVAPRRKSVNLFGLSLFERYPEGNLEELKRLLGLCGITVNCALSMGCGVDALRAIPEASLNVGVFPEKCQETLKWLSEAWGMPAWACEGLPIGFAATEAFIRAICERVGADCGPAMEDVRRARARAYYFIAKNTQGNGIPKNMRYAVEGEYSMLHGYISFMTGYLGVKAACIHPLYPECGQCRRQVEAQARRWRMEAALEADIMEAQDDDVLDRKSVV